MVLRYSSKKSWKNGFETIETVSNGKEVGVSGSIQSTKMYSCAQYVAEMYPAWPVWSRDLAPSTLSTYPPPYLPWVLGT
jgi:hypothetical protein